MIYLKQGPRFSGIGGRLVFLRGVEAIYMRSLVAIEPLSVPTFQTAIRNWTSTRFRFTILEDS